jgi:hypothetical protein
MFMPRGQQGIALERFLLAVSRCFVRQPCSHGSLTHAGVRFAAAN